MFAVRLRILGLGDEERATFAAVGFGVLLLAGACCELRRMFPAQETIAGAARLMAIVGVVVFGLTAGASGE